jgi:hypothetical protein
MDIEKPIVDRADTMKNTGKPQTGRLMSCLVRLPDFILWNPALQTEIRENYDAVKGTCDILREKMDEAAAAMKDPSSPQTMVMNISATRATLHVAPRRLHAFYQKAYAVFRAVAILLNGILRVYEPHDDALERENADMGHELINLSLEGSIWKPIGAGWVPVCLICAWGATTDPMRRARMEKIWNDCWSEITPQSLDAAAASIGDSFDQLRLAAMRSEALGIYAEPFTTTAALHQDIY